MVGDSVGKNYNLLNSRVEKFLKAYMTERVDMINATTRVAVQKALESDDPQAAVRHVFEVARDSRAKIIALTEVTRSSNFGAIDAGKWVGALEFKRWITQEDLQVRDAHEHMQNQVVPWNDPFEAPNGSHAQWPGGFSEPELSIGCFPGDVPVSFSGLQKVYRRRYEGDLAVLTLNDGRQFPVTPNHPLLTKQGWRPAGSLEQGDHLISSRFVDHVIGARSQPNPYQRPMMIEQVFGFGAKDMPPWRALGEPADFHGDGRYGDVDIELIDSKLMDRLKASFFQEFDQRRLINPDDSGLGFRALNEFVMRTFHATYGAMGRFAETLAFLVGGSSHAMEHAFASIARFDASLQQAASNRVTIDAEFASDLFFGKLSVKRGHLLGSNIPPSVPRTIYAERREASIKGRPPDAEALADLLGSDRFRNQIADQCVNVVGKTVVRWSGHVFNLETASGHYSAMGAACQNCRCAAIPARAAQQRELGDYADAVALYDDVRAPAVTKLEAAWRQVFDEQEAAILAELG